VLKMGRTENQDAVPMTLGQEFSAYAVMIESAAAALQRQPRTNFSIINMGATAIGTGMNSPPGYADRVTQKLSEVSGFQLRRAEQPGGGHPERRGFRPDVGHNEAGGRADLQDLQRSALDVLGPALRAERNQSAAHAAGIVDHAGKVNPVIPELVNQVCYQIIGYDAVVSMAAEASELELCMAEPIIAYDLLHGMMILKNACITLTSRCITGITANRDVCRKYVENSASAW
jgi:aspartate ammonia-lyase